MQIVYDNVDLRISQQNIGASITVVTFAGAKRRIAGETSNEFYRSLRAASNKDRLPNIISVVDQRICFYNEGLTRKIADIVNQLILRSKCSSTITLGASMGGFGAVMSAHMLVNCRKSIAFGAHYSVHPSVVPFDTRSRERRSRIQEWDFLHAGLTLAADIRYDLFYGREHRIDRDHALLYLRQGLPNLSVRFVAGADHNVASYLRSRGQLHSLLDAAIWDEPDKMRAALSLSSNGPGAAYAASCQNAHAHPRATITTPGAPPNADRSHPLADRQQAEV